MYAGCGTDNEPRKYTIPGAAFRAKQQAQPRRDDIGVLD